MDEKPVEGRSSKNESSDRGKEGRDAHNQPKVHITTRPVLATPPEVADINFMLGKVPPDTLGLFILNSGDLVLIERAGRVTLGRDMDDAGTSISIDLTPYGGAQSGVSRRHAAILVYQDMYLLQDLGSTNGTWLNAVCLPAHSSHVLKSGDMIQLGQIRMQVVFHASKPGQGSGGPDAVDSTPPTTSSNSDEGVDLGLVFRGLSTLTMPT